MLLVLGESLMDCVVQSNGDYRPHVGGSPFNLAVAASRMGAQVGYLNPLSTDAFGAQLHAHLCANGVAVLSARSHKPTSLALVQLIQGQPSYSFYRQGTADLDWDVSHLFQILKTQEPGVLHTGSLMLLPDVIDTVRELATLAQSLGWVLSVDVNLRLGVATNPDSYLNAVRAFIPLADWLKVSDEDLRALQMPHCDWAHAQLAAAELSRMGSFQRLALTYGAMGAYLQVGNRACTQVPPRIDLVDTVGAGDTFWGACLALWSQTELKHHSEQAHAQLA